jgi:hypothetical protein
MPAPGLTCGAVGPPPHGWRTYHRPPTRSREGSGLDEDHVVRACSCGAEVALEHPFAGFSDDDAALGLFDQITGRRPVPGRTGPTTSAACQHRHALDIVARRVPFRATNWATGSERISGSPTPSPFPAPRRGELRTAPHSYTPRTTDQLASTMRTAMAIPTIRFCHRATVAPGPAPLLRARMASQAPSQLGNATTAA